MTSVLSLPQSLQPVPFEDLKNYAGKWFEIASFPQGFKKGCNFTTAEYSLNDQFYVKGTKGLVKNQPLTSGEKNQNLNFFGLLKGNIG